MKKVRISLTEFDKKKGIGCGRRTQSEELKAIYDLSKGECCCLSYQTEIEFEKARARIANIKKRFPLMFEYFSDRDNNTIYMKKSEQEEF